MLPYLEFPAPQIKDNKWVQYQETEKTGGIEKVAFCPFCMSNDIEPILIPQVYE
jgi:hypothetical protein